MQLITPTLKHQLLNNWKLTKQTQEKTGKEPDHMPVVKLFNPCGDATWLLTELDPGDNDTAFGLCDLGMGEPELGYVSLWELSTTILPYGLGIERDRHFTAEYPLSHYVKEARKHGRIIA